MSRARKIAAPLPLLDFVEKLSGPKFTAPTHLAALAELFERADREPVLATASTGPRLGKTELEKHAIARRLLLRPETRVGFASYSASFAQKKSREIRALYLRAGGAVDPAAKSRADWRTGAGEGGVWAGGIEGGWTGEGFDLLVVDDPVADRAHAESGIERERLWDWFTSVGIGRLEPGASCIITHTRWTPDDLIGRVSSRLHWPHVKLPVLDLEGRAIWPERYSAEKLAAIRETVGPYVWASMYMQDPYGRGGQLFAGDVQFYDGLPSPLRFHVGCDFAYSTRTKSDWSVGVVIAECAGYCYVVEVLRLQVRAPEFRSALQELCGRYGGVRPFAWVSGTEKGTTDMMASQGLAIDTRPALADKFTRAQGVAAAWTAGKILLPRAAPWLDPFVSEIVSFTGSKDVHDDCVDALAAAYERVNVDAAHERYWRMMQRTAESLPDRTGSAYGPGPTPEEQAAKVRSASVATTRSPTWQEKANAEFFGPDGPIAKPRRAPVVEVVRPGWLPRRQGGGRKLW